MKKQILQKEVARFLEAWFSVRQFIQAANFNRFQGAGLSATQFMTLNLLPTSGEGMAIGELARRMNLKPATVAKTVDSLQARKMVTRAKGFGDKRMVFVRVTKVGANLQNAANGHFHAQIEEIFRAMLPGEREGLITGLEGVIRGAGAPKSSKRGKLNAARSAAPRGTRN